MPYGITPAYAGTTVEGPEGSGKSKDHPRLCGDHRLVRKELLLDQGSPPLMRGPPLLRTMNLSVIRITPAYAGTTRPPPSHRYLCRDHPRLCGDHWEIKRRAIIDWGSPPLMRGPQKSKK